MANRDHAHRLLQCLTVAIRPLRVDELAEILALDFEGATPTLNKDWRWEDRQRAVLSTCSSLITIVDDGDSRVIQFSHFSVKEFLTSNRLSTSKGDVSHFHILPEPAHTTLAQACLGTLLQLDGSSNGSLADGSFPLAEYASRHWVEHAQFGMVSSRIEDGMRRLFDSAQPYFAAWLELHDVDEGWVEFEDYESSGQTAGRGSPLYYASLCGFRNLAAHIIVEHPEQVNTRGGRNLSPLMAALYQRDFNIAELLHQHGADVDVPYPNYENRTVLHITALDRKPIDAARWLLDRGADADSQDDNHSTPIHFAAANGPLDLVRILLRHNVRISVANDQGHTPLHHASYWGHVEIVRLLLQHGADISAKDMHYSTPLHDASSQGRLEVARLLLDHFVDVDAENKDGSTPLHRATSNDEAEIVHLLLDRGANADAKKKDGSTPLHLAWGAEVVRLFLDCGANADAKDKTEWTPLHKASSEGRAEIVRLLLDRGASVGAKDKAGRTPVQVASGEGKDEILRMLALDR